MQDYFFISETDGGLYDTRDPDWSSNPLRENYRRHHANIKSPADLKATLRAGKYAWPGGYPLFFVTANGGTLSFEGVSKDFESHMSDFFYSGDRSIQIIACEINYENTLYCEDSGELIESAYGD